MEDCYEEMLLRQWVPPAEAQRPHNLSIDTVLVQSVYHTVCISEVFVTKFFSYFLYRECKVLVDMWFRNENAFHEGGIRRLRLRNL